MHISTQQQDFLKKKYMAFIRTVELKVFLHNSTF